MIVPTLLAVFNICGLYIGGWLNAAGSGSFNGAILTWTVGGLWLFAFTYASWRMCMRGQSGLGTVIALLPWPAASFVGFVLSLGKSILNS